MVRVHEREKSLREMVRAAHGTNALRQRLLDNLQKLKRDVDQYSSRRARLREHLSDLSISIGTPPSCALCGWAANGGSFSHEAFVSRGIEDLDRGIIHLRELASGHHATLRGLGCLPHDAPPDGPPDAERFRSKSMKSLRTFVLNECHIVFCTMSSAAEPMVSEMPGGFEIVLLDEAAQANEIATLVPMTHGARLVCMIGDPNQLPATVVSPEAKARGYGTSLFERLQNTGHPVHVLETQYRMHSAIRAFPSRHFYASQLIDSESITRMVRKPPGSEMGPPALFRVGRHSDQTHLYELRLAPYAFVNVRGGVQEHGASGQSHSLLNKAEAALCAALVYALRRAACGTPSDERPAGGGEPKPCKHCGREPFDTGSGRCGWGDLCGRIVVLTPYVAQRDEIRRAIALVTQGLNLPQDAIEVSSVDAYQGREADIVLLSCVRAGTGPIGFVRDKRRLNVALTRARHALYVIGSEPALRQGSTDWNALLDDAKSRGLWCDIDEHWLKGILTIHGGEGHRKLCAKFIQSLPHTLLDGCKPGLSAPPPREGLLVELLPRPGRPYGPPPVIPTWVGY